MSTESESTKKVRRKIETKSQTITFSYVSGFSVQDFTLYAYVTVLYETSFNIKSALSKNTEYLIKGVSLHTLKIQP